MRFQMTTLTEHTFQEAGSVSKKDSCPLPANEDMDEGPTYRQILATVLTLQGLSIPEEFSEQPY